MDTSLSIITRTVRASSECKDKKPAKWCNKKKKKCKRASIYKKCRKTCNKCDEQPTLVSLIEVQDILIIFQQFSSQEALIRDRTFINFSRKHEVNSVSKTSKQGKNVVKIMS